MSAFFEISLILAVATLVSFVMRYLKQPLIVGYILSGMIVGPYALDILHSHEIIELFAQFGIVILLFIIGMHLSPRIVKELGKTSFLVGVGQIFFTSIIGFTLALLLGIDKVAALYVSIALTLSSTIVILKLIADKGDTHKLYSKLAISLLIIQDIVATFILLVASSFNTSDMASQSYESFAFSILKAIVLVTAFGLAIKYVVPPLSKYASKSQELLFLFALSWGLGTALVFSFMGLSVEVGALVAGVALSTSEYAEEIASKLQPLRDFFIILFFIFLGSNIIIDLTLSSLVPILALSLFVLIGNPVILIIIMNLLGYHKKTSYMTGMAIAQISEFSLVLATIGFQVGHLSQEVVSLITIVGVITIAFSSYFITYSERMYPHALRVLTFLELRKGNKKKKQKKNHYDVFLFGYNRSGRDMLETFKDMHYKTAVIDRDPDTADQLPKTFRNYLYGDAGDVEFLQSLPLKSAKMVVSTLPGKETNKLLIKHLAKINAEAVFFIYAHTKKDALEYYNLGVDYVVLPHHIGVKHAAKIIKRTGINTGSFKRKRKLHIKELAVGF